MYKALQFTFIDLVVLSHDAQLHQMALGLGEIIRIGRTNSRQKARGIPHPRPYRKEELEELEGVVGSCDVALEAIYGQTPLYCQGPNDGRRRNHEAESHDRAHPAVSPTHYLLSQLCTSAPC